MGKMNQQAQQQEEERPTTPVATGFADESEFQEVRTDYNFYNPSFEKILPSGQTEIQRHPDYAPDGLITLRGIPLARRMRPARQKFENGKPVQDGAGHPVYDDPRPYYVFVLTAKTLVKNIEGEWKVAEPGEMVWVDQRAKQAIIEEFLPHFQRDERGEDDTKLLPSAVYEMILRPLKLNRYADKKSGEARKAWQFQQKQLRRVPRDNWGVLESVKGAVTYLPPATPEFDPEELAELKKLSF